MSPKSVRSCTGVCWSWCLEIVTPVRDPNLVALPRLTAHRAATIEPTIKELIIKVRAHKNRSQSNSRTLSSMRVPPHLVAPSRYLWRTLSILPALTMETLFGVIPLNDSHNRSFSHDLHLIIGQPGNNRKGYDDPAARKTIPADG